MVDLASATFHLTLPITWDEMLEPGLGMYRQELRGLGVHLIPDDLPALNAAYAAAPPEPLTEDLAIRSDFESIVVGRRRRAIGAAMHTVARNLLAAGVSRPDPETVQGTTPDPSAWPDGVTFHAVIETAGLAFASYQATLDALVAAGGTPPPALPELGRLFTEDELAQMMSVSVQSLRAWRSKGHYFEWIKWPGKRGTVRYTERGIIRFAQLYLQLADLRDPGLRLPQ